MEKYFCRLLLVSLLALPFVGCSEAGGVKVLELGQEVKRDALAIYPEAEYELPEDVYASYGLVCGGRYVVCHMQTKEFAGEVYDLQEGKIVGKFLRYGNGPGEVNLPVFYVNSDTLYVNDFPKKKLYSIPLGEMPEAVATKVYDVEFTSAQYFPYKGRLLALNPYYLKIDELGIDNEESLLFLSDGKEKPYDESKIFSMNVVQGSLMARPDGERIVFSNSTEPLVVFLDSNLQIFSEVHGPEDYKVSYVQAGVLIAQTGTICNSYLSACSDENHVYLLYEGQEREVRDESVDWEQSQHNLYVFQFDWDGNLVDSYELEGVTHTRTNLSAGTEPGTFYVSTVAPDEENLKILYYDLNKVSR